MVSNPQGHEAVSSRDDASTQRSGQQPEHHLTNGLASDDGTHQAHAPNSTLVNGDETQHHHSQTPPPASHISLDSSLTGVRRSTEVGEVIFPRDDLILFPQGRLVTSTGAGTATLSQGRPVDTGDVQAPHRVQGDAAEVLLYIGSVFVDDERLLRCLVQGARRRLAVEAGRGEPPDVERPAGRNENRRRRHT